MRKLKQRRRSGERANAKLKLLAVASCTATRQILAVGRDHQSGARAVPGVDGIRVVEGDRCGEIETATRNGDYERSIAKAIAGGGKRLEGASGNASNFDKSGVKGS